MAMYVCEACTEPIKLCGTFFFPEDRPSPLFSTFSVLCNLVGGILCIVQLVQPEVCVEPTRTWLILGIANHAANILFAFYLYFRFAAKIQGGASVSDAVTKLFFYDWGVCCYMCVGIWLVVWMVMAGGRMTYNDACATGIKYSLTAEAVYIGLGFFLLIFSVCTECCREPKWKHRQNAGAPAGIAYVPANNAPMGGAYSQQPPPRQGLVGGLVGGVVGSLFGPTRPPPQRQQAPPVVVATAAPSYAYQQQPQVYAAPPPQQPVYVAAAAPQPYNSAPVSAGVYAPPPSSNPAYQPQYQR